MTPIFEWRVYCILAGLFVSYYGPTAPTYCPIDITDTINPDSISIVRELESQIKQITDANPDTARFQTSSVVVDIPAMSDASSIINKDVSFPFDMYLWQLSISNTQVNMLDTLSIQVSPNTIIGLTTTTTAPGATQLNVSSTVVENLLRGMEIGITDGVNTEYPGMVIELDPNNNSLKNSAPVTNGYAAGSYITTSTYPIRNLRADYTNYVTIGSKGLKYSLIPANTIVRIIYTDNTPSENPSQVFIHIQYYYQ